jgi:methylmalonyl-CoA mutase
MSAHTETVEISFPEFESAGYDAWRAEADATLAGAPFEKKLVTRTAEGIDIQPIYTKVENPAPAPSIAPFTRGTHTEPRAWEIVENQPAEIAFNRNALAKIPTIGTVEIGVGQYHDDGANAAQEIAFALATGVAYIREHGIEIAPRLRFTFAIGADFFMAIAKLRAARTLWCRVAEACGATGDSRKMRIHARTSLWNKSSLDLHTNLLRATTEAAAAVLGGCDSLYVGAFDEVLRKPDDFSHRIARNIQIILRDECNFNGVIDPAGGSYYVETLTQQLAAASWKIFQGVEKHGGILASLESGWVHEHVKAVADQKIAALAFRRTSLIGVNVYANANEKPLAGRIPGRAAEPWEKLRVAVDEAGRPKIFLANMGPVRQHKPRADFSTGFFQAGGFEVLENRGFPTIEAAAEAAQKSGARVVVICSTDETYPELVPPLVAALKALPQKPVVVLAGYPQEHVEKFKAAGVDAFIHVRANCYETLREIAKKIGVKL